MNKMIEELIEAAKRGDWTLVDMTIPEAVKYKPNVIWASKEGLKDYDGKIRDLAASMLEKADIPSDELPSIRARLALQLGDSHPYARFRAACALAAHNPEDHKGEVLVVLKEFRDDKDVREIARKYIAQLG